MQAARRKQLRRIGAPECTAVKCTLDLIIGITALDRVFHAPGQQAAYRMHAGCFNQAVQIVQPQAWTCGVMHQRPAVIAQIIGQSRDAGQYTVTPAHAAGAGAQRFVAPHFDPLPTLIVGSQGEHEPVDIGMLRQHIQHMFNHRLAQQRPVLFGNVGARAGTATGCRNDGPDHGFGASGGGGSSSFFSGSTTR